MHGLGGDDEILAIDGIADRAGDGDAEVEISFDFIGQLQTPGVDIGEAAARRIGELIVVGRVGVEDRAPRQDETAGEHAGHVGGVAGKLHRAARRSDRGRRDRAGGRRGAESRLHVHRSVGGFAEGDEALKLFLQLDLAVLAAEAGDLGLVAGSGQRENSRVLFGLGVNIGAVADLEALGHIAIVDIDLERPADLDPAPAGRGLTDDGDGGAALQAGEDG